MVAYLRSVNWDLDMVLLELNLPGTTGLEVFKSLYSEMELPPFMMLADAGSEPTVAEALESGIYDYIIKDPGRGYLQVLPLKLKNVMQQHKDRLLHRKAQSQFKKAHDELETLIMQRTTELARTITRLEEEVAFRKRTEEALRRSEKSLRFMSYKIIETQENERGKMAKELHDSIGSSLAAIKFAIEEKLAFMTTEPPEDIISLEKIVEHIKDTVNEVRRLSTNLRPSILDDMGLLAAIGWHCRKSAEIYMNAHIETKLDIDENEIPDISRIVIYRILQEALNNALKHGNADTLKVSLAKEEDGIRMCVTDNGCGFNLQEIMENRDSMTGYGLKGMYDRTQVVGGSLSIDSGPEQGTSVCLTLPLILRDAVQ
jgi:signal transduction histidine kinase